MRGTIAVVLAGILGCAESAVLAPPVDHAEPLREPTTAPAPTPACRYTLVLVNDRPLPSESPTGAGQWDYDGAIVKLVGASLEFFQDGTITESWLHHSSLAGLVTQTCTGLFTRISDSTIRIGSGEASTIVTVTATGLVWQLPGFTLTYELQKE